MGQTVQIKGIVLSAGISRFLTPYVELSERQGGPALARFVLPCRDVIKLSSSSPGQSVTMSGRVHRLNENRVPLKESGTIEQVTIILMPTAQAGFSIDRGQVDMLRFLKFNFRRNPHAVHSCVRFQRKGYGN